MQWTFPINGIYRITQKFGQNLLDYSRIGLKAHNGYDFAAPRGTPVVAPADGIIVEANNDAKPGTGGYGNEVRLLLKTGVQDLFYDHIFAHFLTVLVKPGQQVQQGDVLGLIDSTGFSTGDHLHWGVRYAKKTGTGNGTFKKYLGEVYLLLNYDNGYFGYFDHNKLFSDSPIDVYPVDMRYGQSRSGLREWAWALRHEQYAMKRALKVGVPYSDRLMKAFVYGYWDAESVYQPAMFAVWAELTKPGFEKIKKIGRTIT